MSIEEIVDLFSDRPLKITSVHKDVITRMIAVCRAAQDWAEENDEPEFCEALTDAISDLLEYDE